MIRTRAKKTKLTEKEKKKKKIEQQNYILEKIIYQTMQKTKILKQSFISIMLTVVIGLSFIFNYLKTLKDKLIVIWLIFINLLNLLFVNNQNFIQNIAHDLVSFNFALVFLLSNSKYLSYFTAFIVYLTLVYRVYLKECPFNYNINKNKETTLFIEEFINFFLPQKIEFLNKIDIILIIAGFLFILKGKLLKN